MSVYVTLRVQADPAAFEKAGAADPAKMARIMEIAKSNGLIAHRWFGGDGVVMAVDEWPAAENFHAFFDAAGPEIGPFMAAVGVSAPPEVTVWDKVDLGDVFGWGA